MPDSPNSVDALRDMFVNDRMPPTQSLVLEVLAGRWRLGEPGWTFSTRNRPALKALEALGLVSWKHWTLPGSCLAWLTETGKEVVLSATYKAPAVDGAATEWGIRHPVELTGGDHVRDLGPDSEETARLLLLDYRRIYGDTTVLVRRQRPPWEEVPDA